MTDQPLTSLEMMENGRIAAVGSADGSTTIVQFSDGLVDMQLNEKQALTSVSYSRCRGFAYNMCQSPSHSRMAVIALCTCTMLNSGDQQNNFKSSSCDPAAFMPAALFMPAAKTVGSCCGCHSFGLFT